MAAAEMAAIWKAFRPEVQLYGFAGSESQFQAAAPAEGASRFIAISGSLSDGASTSRLGFS